MTRWLTVSLVLTAAAWLVWFYVFWLRPDLLVDPVPTHWDINMQVDGTVPRDHAWKVFLLYPAGMVLMVVLMLVLPWLSPKHFKIDSFKNVFAYVMALVVLLFAYLGALHLVAATTDGGLPSRAFIGGFFLFFALLGGVMGKVQRNFWMGVRTPWTLANETVWARTHQLAGKLWVAAGAVGFVAVLAGAPWWICFAGLIASALYPVLYSLILYKKLERQGKID